MNSTFVMIYVIKNGGDPIFVGAAARSVNRIVTILKKSKNKTLVTRWLNENPLDAITVEFIEEAHVTNRKQRIQYWIDHYGTERYLNRVMEHGLIGIAPITAIEKSIEVRTGMKHSDKTKARMRDAHKRKRRSNMVPVICDQTGEEFSSISVAARHYGVTLPTLYKRIHPIEDYYPRNSGVRDLTFSYKNRSGEALQ